MSFPPPTPRQARVLWFSITTLTLALIVGLVSVGLGWLLKRLSAVLLPVALALIVAYILDPLVEYFVRKKVPRIWSILLVFLIGVLAISGLIGSVVPDLIKETRKLVQILNSEDIHRQVTQMFNHSPIVKQLNTTLIKTNVTVVDTNHHHTTKKVATNIVVTNEVVSTATTNTNTNSVQISLSITIPPKTNTDGTIATNAPVELSANAEQLGKVLEAPFSETIIPALAKALVSAVNWIPAQLGKVTTWVEFLVGFVLVPVYVFYFLLEKHGINKHWTDYLPVTESRAKEELVFVLRAINECLIVFFRGQVLVALCVGIMLTISYWLLGLNYAVLLGVIAGTLGIVPYLGTIASLAVALTVAGVQFHDWTHPLCVLGIAAVVKLLEDFLISPKIIGDRSGLHPLTIILAVMIGAKLMGGFLGALLAVPLTAVLRTLMFRYVWKRRPRRSKVVDPKVTADLAS